MAETETKKKVPTATGARAGKPAAGPHASLSFLRVAPRKVRLVADHVRGMQVGEALAMLRYTPQSAAKPLAVDGGPKMRRFMPRAMGRAFRIEKRTSHVYVELGTGSRAARA